MPLPPAGPRQLVHTRQITCRACKRDDGLWDVEGLLVDTKTHSFKNRFRGTVTPGEALHRMWLRLTVDDSLTVRGVEAVTERSPFAACPDVTDRYRQLVGLRIAPGWSRRVRRLLGGVAGCTHLVELTGPIATTAIQAIGPLRQAPADPAVPPPMLDSCHIFRADGPVVRELWPDHYTGPPAGDRVGEA